MLNKHRMKTSSKNQRPPGALWPVDCLQIFSIDQDSLILNDFFTTSRNKYYPRIERTPSWSFCLLSFFHTFIAPYMGYLTWNEWRISLLKTLCKNFYCLFNITSNLFINDDFDIEERNHRHITCAAQKETKRVLGYNSRQWSSWLGNLILF